MVRVGMVFGGRSVEHRVSIVSARTVSAALEQAGYQPVALGIAENGRWVESEQAKAALDGDTDALRADGAVGGAVALTLTRLFEAKVDVVFPILHGTWGEDGTFQGFCEIADLPYVGAGVAASAIAMDKIQCKLILRAHGVPVVPWVTLTRDAAASSSEELIAEAESLPLPWFVKPSVGGSSVGVRRVERSDDLMAAVQFALGFDDRVLIEQGIQGRELECSVLGLEVLEASAVGEIVPGAEFYDYADKYLEDDAQLILPAELPAPTEERIRSLAVQAFGAIGGSGMARVDFLLDEDGEVYVSEINTLPGFTSISMYPKLWEISGLPLPQLVDRLVQIALRRHRARRRLDRGIKEWLGSLEG